jgi:hypothetical protein
MRESDCRVFTYCPERLCREVAAHLGFAYSKLSSDLYFLSDFTVTQLFINNEPDFFRFLAEKIKIMEK